MKVVILAGGPAVLVLNSGGLVPLLGTTGLVEHTDDSRTTMPRGDPLLESIAHQEVVPLGQGQELLQGLGSHAGGRTTFTLDITNAVKTDGTQNTVIVKASHPANIQDLPWVCGGCSNDRGFSEGSQPLGIFRPVHLIITNDVCVEPFGVHAWTDIRDKGVLIIETTIRNYSLQKRELVIVHELLDSHGKGVLAVSIEQTLNAGDSGVSKKAYLLVNNPILWSPGNPYLYKIVTFIKEGNGQYDNVETGFGFRTISWKNPTNQDDCTIPNPKDLPRDSWTQPPRLPASYP